MVHSLVLGTSEGHDYNPVGNPRVGLSNTLFRPVTPQ
jgi:hypothetical protein